MTTANLGLPLIEASQAQKHVTHNEALFSLDGLVQLAVLSSALSVPPSSPSEGQRWIVAASASGAWAGKSGQVAAYYDGDWLFLAPKPGWLAYDLSMQTLLAWSGTAWVNALAAFQNLPLLGVNTTADSGGRLAVKSDSAVLSHDDVTPGSGHMRVTINKSAAAKDAGVVLQDNWGTRALFGLFGNDDFVVKLTPDAANYYAGLRAWSALHGRLDFKDARRRQPMQWSPRPGSTTLDMVGLGATLTGTATAVSPSAGNLFLSSPRLDLVSSATSGASAGVSGSALTLWRGNATSLGGFYLLMRFGIEWFQTNCRLFAGLYGSASPIGNVAPSTLLNLIGVGFESGDTTLSLLSNDGSGVATKTSLGAGFPTTGGQDLYELLLSAEPNGSEIRYRVERLNSGDVATGVVTSDLPAATQFLTPHLWMNNGSTAASVNVALFQMYAEPAALLGSRGAIG
ncbi:DUF2793 domain-containing protein [Rhodopseudomonas sp. BR0M22]|uniref:DUF2793 domain-containing protein n=1 Tax=Rhodopseudomonas sp. BR0M22 TaxID=2269369 RepID=UPI0013E0A689|nr:DUF2793 domain-containing protein [Rhodopseudomonas sp. BR0M22]NEW93022.1 DUF2793 domain-containing protein [Rhodopseudomonas sp. BR0M22]